MKKAIANKKTDEALVLRNQLARALADYDNLHKRVERERTDFEQTANLKLAIRLLPVLDILKQAQGHLKDPGISLTIKEFTDALSSVGIEEITTKPGEDFNPLYHEATEVVEDGQGKAKIKEVARPGWQFKGGPVIRHTQVKVSMKENK